MTAALAYFVTIGTVAGPFDRAAADAEIIRLRQSGISDEIGLHCGGEPVAFEVQLEPRVIHAGEGETPAPKPARSYKPRKANLDAVMGTLNTDVPRTVEALAKVSGCGKPVVAAVLGYLAAQSLAVETPDGWRLMPGATP